MTKGICIKRVRCRKSNLIFLLFFLLVSPPLISQVLTQERISKIKDCTVRVTIEGTSALGSGFFFNDAGAVLTCWHVIEPAMIRDSSKKIVSLRRTFITLRSGEKIQMGYYEPFLAARNLEAVAFDFCVLVPVGKRMSPFLKMGDFNKAEEGDEVYTCGFPAGIEQQFVSKGMVSTKFEEKLNSVNYNGTIIQMPRMHALLD